MQPTLTSTSTRTFVLWPLFAAVWQAVFRRPLRPRYLLLLPWGFLQYRLSGARRTRLGGGGPGMSTPPERLVETGVYRWTRNPMYLGHLVFLAGLALSTGSPVVGAVLGWHLPWFDKRARRDEAALEARFGAAYREYRDRVPRWLPGLPGR